VRRRLCFLPRLRWDPEFPLAIRGRAGSKASRRPGSGQALGIVVIGVGPCRLRPQSVTTNKPLAALGQVLLDGDLAEAILDRLLQRCSHYMLRGRSIEPVT
jgi:hypothetical protein